MHKSTYVYGPARIVAQGLLLPTLPQHYLITTTTSLRSEIRKINGIAPSNVKAMTSTIVVAFDKMIAASATIHLLCVVCRLHVGKGWILASAKWVPQETFEEMFLGPTRVRRRGLTSFFQGGP